MAGTKVRRTYKEKGGISNGYRAENVVVLDISPVLYSLLSMQANLNAGKKYIHTVLSTPGRREAQNGCTQLTVI